MNEREWMVEVVNLKKARLLACAPDVGGWFKQASESFYKSS